VARIADRITVLRDGAVVATGDAADLPRAELVRLMVGRDVDEAAPTVPPGPFESALRVSRLRAPGVHGVDLEVGRGEIVGLAGLLGAGRSALLRALFGATAAVSGELRLRGSSRTAPFCSPREAARHGLRFVSEDRKADGLLLPLSVRANVTLGHLGRAVQALGLVSLRREEALARPMVEAAGVKSPTLGRAVAELSGGNQQKVLLARALLGRPTVLLVDEPTRGVDVGARAEVHRLLREAAAAGAAVVVASSDVDELIALGHRIVVLDRGRIAGTFDRGALTRERILEAAIPAAPAPAPRIA
jgi:ribose transport system ATP-binding protein